MPVKTELLTEQSRRDLIEAMLDEDMEYYKKHDGIETNYRCDRHNGGWKGYTNFTDKELLQRVCELHYGLQDIEFI